jgi:MinD-like ATPase involved in chromosome partitioning or flagellar assembly
VAASIKIPVADATLLGSRSLRMPPAFLDATRKASLQLGGPTLTNLGVTSALRGEGRTSVVIALAVLQRDDYNRRVILVDADLERPTLAARLGMEVKPGLCELIRGEVGLEQAIQELDDRLAVVAAGDARGNPARLVLDLFSALDVIEARCDVVIADLPPVLGSGLGAPAAVPFDPLLMVVRGGVTPAARVREAAATLSVTPTVLLNGVHSGLPRWIRRLTGE